jgi:hypothetical protein
LLPGTTGVDPSAALILLRTADVGKKDTIIDELTRNATFVSDDDQTIPAVASLRTTKMPPEGIAVTVTPSVTLKADHWYTFVLNQDSDVQLSNGKSPADLAARTTSVWKSDFFTGSAPHLVGIRRPLGAKDGAYIHLTLSEPVPLASIQLGALTTVDGVPIAKCIMMGGECAPSLSGAVAEEFDVLPVRALGQFVQMDVAIPGALQGHARTASGALAVAGSRIGATHEKAGMVGTTIAQSGWRACDEGASRCWQAHNQ